MGRMREGAGRAEGEGPKEAERGLMEKRERERGERGERVSTRRGAVSAAVFDFSFFLFSARISNLFFHQNAPPVSGTLAGFCEWRG